MIENHTFINAFFTDNDRTVIESLWENNDTKKIVPYHIVAEDNEPAYQKLLEYIDIDSLHESTFKEIKRKREARNSMLLEIAKQEGLMPAVGNSPDFWKTYAAEMLTHEYDEDADKENLFAYKLELFNNEKIKNSTNREMKAALRKSKNFLEATKAALDIIIEDT